MLVSCDISECARRISTPTYERRIAKLIADFRFILFNASTNDADVPLKLNHNYRESFQNLVRIWPLIASKTGVWISINTDLNITVPQKFRSKHTKSKMEYMALNLNQRTLQLIVDNVHFVTCQDDWPKSCQRIEFLRNLLHTRDLGYLGNKILQMLENAQLGRKRASWKV